MNTNELFSLQGRIALVTGGSRGIGRMIAKGLLCQGAKVYITARKAAACDATAQEFSAFGTCISMPLDVSHKEGIQELVKHLSEKEKHLDILVNNAGIGFMMEPLVDMPLERWNTVIGVNLTGAFLCTQHAARQMIQQGRGGRIINIASVAAKSGSLHLAAYSSSKHGMIGLTRSAALELGAHRITVNAICPNHVTTQLGAVQNAYRATQRGQTVEAYLAEMRGRIPLGRVGLAEDTAKACAFLCSDEAQYVTGEAMNVSGGQEMH